MAAQRRGLDYEVRTKDSFSTTLDTFITKVGAAKSAWRSFRRSVGNSGRLSIKTASKDASRNLQESAKHTKEASRHAVRLARNVRRAADASAKLAANMNRAAAATKKASTAAAGYSRQADRASLFQSKLNSKLARTLVIFGRILGIFALFRGIQAVFGVLGAAIREAVGFSSRIEDSRIAIQALVASVFEIGDATGTIVEGADKFNRAFSVAEEQVKKLRIEGLRTAATFDQLLDTFQVAIAPGAQAGGTLDQIRQLAVQVSQAATAIGVPQNQLAEEIRSLTTGAISKRTSRIATALGIEAEDIENAKELGTLFEFLTDQFEQFGTASAAALQNFSTRLSNLRDAVGQTLSEGFANSFQELKDLILDVTSALVDIERLEIAKPFLDVLRIFDQLGQELIGGARGFVNNLDLDSVAVLFQGIADSVRTLVSAFVSVGKIVLPIAEAFTVVFTALVEIAQLLNRAEGVLSVIRATLQFLLTLWASIKAIQLATYLLGGKAIKQLTRRLLVLTGIEKKWKNIVAAQIASNAVTKRAAGAAVVGGVARGAGALSLLGTGGLLAGAAAVLPAILTVVAALAVVAVVFGKDIKKAFLNLVGGAQESEDAMTGLSKELVGTIVLVDDAVNRANESIETLSKGFEGLQVKAEQAEFTSGFTGLSKRAAQLVAATRIEFEDELDVLRTRAGELEDLLAPLQERVRNLGFVIPEGQGDDTTVLGTVGAYAAVLQKLEESGEALDALASPENLNNFESIRAEATEIYDRLKELGVDPLQFLDPSQAQAFQELGKELRETAFKLQEVRAAEVGLAGSVLATIEIKLRGLLPILRAESKARAEELGQERSLTLQLLDAEQRRADLAEQTEGSDLSARIDALRREFTFRKLALADQITQTKQLLELNEESLELQKLLTLQQKNLGVLSEEFANEVLNEVAASITDLTDRTVKLRAAGETAFTEYSRGLALLDVDGAVADLDELILKQSDLIVQAERDISSLQAALREIKPAFEDLGFGFTIETIVDQLTVGLVRLKEAADEQTSGAVGKLVTQQLSEARTEVNGLLVDAATNLEELQATLGSQGVARDLVSITSEVRNQFSELRTGLTDIEGRVAALSAAAASQGNAYVAGIFSGLSQVISDEIERIDSAELQVLRDEATSFALALQDTLDQENRGLDRQLQVQRELNRIEREGYANRQQASLTALDQQRARVQIERQYALIDIDRQIQSLGLQEKLFALLGLEAVLQKTLLDMEGQRLLINQQAEDSLRRIEDLRKREAQRLEDPTGFFFENLPTRAEVASQRTIEALTAIKDFLIDDLSGALVDSLFREEDTLLERAQRLAEQLVQIMLKEFLQNKLFAKILTTAEGPGGDPGDGTFMGGLANRARATAAHVWARAKGYARGGFVSGQSGSAASIGNIPTGTLAQAPPAGIDRRDTVPAWLSPKEYVHPASAVAEYGLAVMDAIRSRRIPAAVLQALVGSTKSSSTPRRYGGSSLGFNAGGPVPAVSGGSAGGGSGVTIVNATNERDIHDAITTSQGQEVVLNVVRFGRDNGLI